MIERARNLNLKVNDDELAMAHALAEAEDRPISAVVRRWIREQYAEQFGEKRPPKPRLKSSR